jgi:multiple sugar transport system substrate-binding protein
MFRGKILFQRLSISLAIFTFTVGLASCHSVPQPSPTILPEDSSSPVNTPSLGGSTPTAIGSPLITLWLPPFFRPESNSPGGKILQGRIRDYETQHPGVSVIVRIKAATGAGGLRDSLAVAAAAAPGALPDLVALDQSNLRAAAIKGLIYPLDDLFAADVWSGCYPYAQSMIETGSRRYGLPFSGDAIVLADMLPSGAGPETWEQTYARTGAMHFTLGDSHSLFLFFGYYAAGGTPFQSLAGVEIKPDPLEKELTWLAGLNEHKILSPRSLQIDSFENAFLLLENYGDSSATLYSLASRGKGYSIHYLPTPEGERFSLATGWSWAVATSDPDRMKRAADLMRWLTDPEFLAQWTAAQGVLPTSRAALDRWPPGGQRDLLMGISEEALAFPEDEISNSIGPIFSKAAREVLSDGVSPASAAREAVQAIHP